MNLWLRLLLPVLLILATGVAATLVALHGTRRDRKRELARRQTVRTVRVAIRTVRRADPAPMVLCRLCDAPMWPRTAHYCRERVS